MDATSLFAHCIGQKHISKQTIRASDVKNHVKCPFLIWADRFAPHQEKDPPTAFGEFKKQQGIAHEASVMKALFPDTVDIPIPPMERGFQLLLMELFAGKKHVKGPLLYLRENLEGVPDILEKKNNHESVFGDYHYTIKEIKFITDPGEDYIMQAAFYNYVLGKIQNYTPPTFSLINRQKKEFVYEFADYEKKLQDVIRNIHNILEGKSIPHPNIRDCAEPWTNLCEKMALKQDDITLVCHVTERVHAILVAAGIKTATSLASTKAASVPGISPEKFEQLRVCANAFVNKKHVVLCKPKFPKVSTEIYLDFESAEDPAVEDVFVRVDYLIGLLVCKNNRATYKPLIAHTFREEKSMFQQLLDFLNGREDYVIYHYGPYDRQRIIALGKKYGVTVDNILEKLIDIYRITQDCIILPTSTMGLKDFGAYLGYKWRAEGVTANESMMLYFQYIETGNKEQLQKILTYNEDDLRSLLAVKRFMETM